VRGVVAKRLTGLRGGEIDPRGVEGKNCSMRTWE
jgi:hypothetical protein